MRKVGEHSLGVLVDKRDLVTDGYKKAVGSRRAVGCVITSVEQKKKFKGEEQLGSLARECVAKVEGELQKRNREIQVVTEAGGIGKDLYQQTVAKDGDETDRNQVMENNESVGGPVLEDQFEEVDGQIRWAVHEGEHLMESLRTGNQDIGARTGPGTSLGHQRKPTGFASKASLAEDGRKD